MHEIKETEHFGEDQIHEFLRRLLQKNLSPRKKLVKKNKQQKGKATHTMSHSPNKSPHKKNKGEPDSRLSKDLEEVNEEELFEYEEEEVHLNKIEKFLKDKVDKGEIMACAALLPRRFLQLSEKDW